MRPVRSVALCALCLVLAATVVTATPSVSAAAEFGLLHPASSSAAVGPSLAGIVAASSAAVVWPAFAPATLTYQLQLFTNAVQPVVSVQFRVVLSNVTTLQYAPASLSVPQFTSMPLTPIPGTDLAQWTWNNTNSNGTCNYSAQGFLIKVIGADGGDRVYVFMPLVSGCYSSSWSSSQSLSSVQPTNGGIIYPAFQQWMQTFHVYMPPGDTPISLILGYDVSMGWQVFYGGNMLPPVRATGALNAYVVSPKYIVNGSDCTDSRRWTVTMHDVPWASSQLESSFEFIFYSHECYQRLVDSSTGVATGVDGGPSLSPAAIAGIVVGGLVGVAFVGYFVRRCFYKPDIHQDFTQRLVQNV